MEGHKTKNSELTRTHWRKNEFPIAPQWHIGRVQYGRYSLPVPAGACLHPLPPLNPPSTANVSAKDALADDHAHDNGTNSNNNGKKTKATLFLCQFCFDYFPDAQLRDRHEADVCRYRLVLPGQCVYADRRRIVHQCAVTAQTAVGGCSSASMDLLMPTDEELTADAIELLDKVP